MELELSKSEITALSSEILTALSESGAVSEGEYYERAESRLLGELKSLLRLQKDSEQMTFARDSLMPTELLSGDRRIPTAGFDLPKNGEAVAAGEISAQRKRIELPNVSESVSPMRNLSLEEASESIRRDARRYESALSKY